MPDWGRAATLPFLGLLLLCPAARIGQGGTGGGALFGLFLCRQVAPPLIGHHGRRLALFHPARIEAEQDQEKGRQGFHAAPCG
jgi:hypothetical protein